MSVEIHKRVETNMQALRNSKFCGINVEEIA